MTPSSWIILGVAGFALVLCATLGLLRSGTGPVPDIPEDEDPYARIKCPCCGSLNPTTRLRCSECERDLEDLE